MRRPLLAVLVAALSIAGCGGGSHHHSTSTTTSTASPSPTARTYRSAPRPALVPGSTVPNCGTNPNDHHAGSCLPQPTRPSAQRPKFLAGAPIMGPDTSNNDPILGDSAWQAIAHQARFGIDKVSESDNFTDAYAAAQAGSQIRAGMAIGGYDFAHVCDNPVSEGDFFAARYKAAGFLRSRAFMPWLDVEYGNASACNARAWLLALIATVRRDLGRDPGIYTGAWYWDPAFGCWWPYSTTVAWISGYGVSYPYMPCGRSHLDIWQWTDHYGILGHAVDWSTYLDGEAQFVKDTLSGPPPPPPDPYHVAGDLLPLTVFFFNHHTDHASEHNTLRAWDAAGCENPVLRTVCKTTHYHLQLLEARLLFVGKHYGGFLIHHRHRISDNIIFRLHATQRVPVGSHI